MAAQTMTSAFAFQASGGGGAGGSSGGQRADGKLVVSTDPRDFGNHIAEIAAGKAIVQ
jgi:hypothetical protein